MMATASPRAEQERMADACMLSLIASMADNKAALGRRYGEWAVSAPTLESAVAAPGPAKNLSWSVG